MRTCSITAAARDSTSAAAGSSIYCWGRGKPCANSDVLEHCRSEGPHARGCWVVDLVLGKGEYPDGGDLSLPPARPVLGLLCDARQERAAQMREPGEIKRRRGDATGPSLPAAAVGGASL